MNTNIRNRVEDAEFLLQNNRLEGAFLSALVAVAATSRLVYPSPTYKDNEAFTNFLKQGLFERISVEYRGKLIPMHQIFYKWVRCELVHDGGVPIDIEFMPDTEIGTVSVRAGGAPDYLLKISRGWFYELIHTVKSAPVNASLFS